MVNNYPLDRVWREVRLGETPDHHLFGINYFHERGYEPIILDGVASRPGGWRGRMPRLRMPVEMGDTEVQREALRQWRRGDLIYAACGTQTHWLHYRRAAGLLAAPIVCLVHHPFLKGRADALRMPFRRLFVRGADYLPTLGSEVARILQRAGASPTRTRVLRWGPQADFYHPSSSPGHGIIAAGRTGRDFDTLARAARRLNTPVTLIGLEGQLTGDLFAGHPTLSVLQQSRHQPQPGQKVGWMKYPELITHLSAARAHAIPLYRQSNLCGLTSLMDALGLGKPIIMTRNQHIDIDIEALGIGFWVEPEDIEGWVRAIRRLDESPELALAMGARARRLVDEGMTSRTFAHQVMDLFDEALRTSTRVVTTNQRVRSAKVV